MNIDFSKIMMIICLLLFALLLWWQDDVLKDKMAGTPKVVDGDSLVFQGERVRLKGIDAPEGRQYCTKSDKKWACGRASTKALRGLIGGKKVACEGSEFDRYQRLLAYCTVDGVEINRWMVREGWAVSYGGGFRGEQRAAKSAQKGLWQGEFMMPGDWRRQNMR